MMREQSGLCQRVHEQLFSSCSQAVYGIPVSHVCNVLAAAAPPGYRLGGVPTYS